MFEAYWLNIASLVLGCIAWGLPIILFIFRKKISSKLNAIVSLLSISSCTVSLCMQIFYTHHLVSIGDWTALMDTSGALALVSLVLVIVTIILNLVVSTATKK